MGKRTKVISKKTTARKRNFASKTRKPELSSTKNSPVDRVLNLQRAAGNQMVQGLFKSGVIQPKLKIGQPGDKYELEADRIAEQVMRMPELNELRVASRESSDKKENKNIQTKENGSNAAEVTPNIESDINSLKSGGQPLSESVRNYFEPRFGYDFGGVRVHTGVEANETARSINARAFTLGKDIVLGTNDYSPETGEGEKLLAHELTHIIQQNQNNTGIQRAPLTEEEKKENLKSEKYAPNQKLQNAFDNAPLLRFGEQGEAVKLIQEGLIEDGFAMPESTKPTGEMDGIFGPETLRTVKQFQMKYGLLIDGIVGRETMGKLDELAQSGLSAPTLPEPIPSYVPDSPLGKGWIGENIPGLEPILPGSSPKAKEGSGEKPTESSRCGIPSDVSITYVPGTDNTWVRAGHIAVCAKEKCTLGVLSQALTKSGDNWPCIGICYMGSPKAASSGKDYYKYIWPGDMFDISNLLQGVGGTSTLKIHLFDTGREPKYAQWVLYFYPDARVEGSSLPDDDIARESGEGSKPIRDFLIFAHSIGEEMIGSSGSFTPDKRPDIPEADYNRAIQSKFPQRCWFAADATCRAVGCNSDAFGKAFAATYLRNGSSIWVTTASVKPVCPYTLTIPYIEDCVLYTGIIFSMSFLPHDGTKLAGPYWTTVSFQSSSYWKSIPGML